MSPPHGGAGPASALVAPDTTTCKTGHPDFVHDDNALSPVRPEREPNWAFRGKLDDARAAEQIAAARPCPIPVRTVPRAAIEALVVRLVAEGVVTTPTREAR